MVDRDGGGFKMERRKMASIEIMSVGGGSSGRIVASGNRRWQVAIAGGGMGLKKKIVLNHGIGSVDRVASP